jgi:hypothetical protein
MAEAPVTPVTAADPATDEPKFVTVEQYNRMQSQFEGLTASVQGISRILRKSEKPADPPPTEKQDLTLKAHVEADKARDQKLRDRAISTELKAFAKENGLALKPFLHYVTGEYKEKISVNENDEVVFEDELGEKHPFAVLGKKILASSDGSTFLPPVETPGEVGSRKIQGGSRLPAGKPLQDWTDEEISKNPEGYREGLRQGLLAQQAAGTTITQ